MRQVLAGGTKPRRLVGVVLALALVLVAALSAAGSGVAASPEVGVLHAYAVPTIPKPKKQYKVVLLQAHRSDAFAISFAQSVASFGKQHGIKVTVQDAGGYQNVQKQLAQIEAAITQKPDAIIFWSTDPTAVVSSLKKASAAGIKIIGAVQPPNMPLKLIVTGDFVVDGKTMATALFKKMGGAGDAAVILGGAGSAYQAALKQGWTQALKNYPNIKVVADQTIPDFDPAKIQSAVEDLLVRQPSLKGVMTSTTAMAAAAADAITSAGKDAASVGEIVGDCGQINLLKAGKLAIVLGVPAVYYGELTVANTIRLLNGLPVKAKTVIPGNVYTPTNIAKAPLNLEIAAQFRKGCS
jgi:ribose transport system substrate-binding protein